MKILVSRYKGQNTSISTATICGLLNDPKTERVIFFASPAHPNDTFGDNDGPETNLPIVAALAEFNIPNVASVYILFDGFFLTAARHPRYTEVRTVLDTAIESKKAYFCAQRAPFTSSLSEESAATTLLNIGNFMPLTNATRSTYFSLLSSVPESSFA